MPSEKREVAWILIAMLIFWFILSFNNPLRNWPLLLAAAVLTIGVNVLAKKIAAPYYNITVVHTLWKIRQYGFQTDYHFKNPQPIGLLPFFIALISNGLIKIPLLLQFDTENLPKKRTIKKSIRSYTEMNESDPGYVAAWGLYAILALAFIGAFLGIPSLTTAPILYGLWNLLPIGQLDGSKLFYGSPITWTLTLIVFILGFAFTF